MKPLDAIIIGAGHNGLSAAAYLARAGKRVLVLERRSIVGGSVVTESFGDGFSADSLWAGGTLRPEIARDLRLSRFGYPASSAPLPFTSLLGGGDRLVLDPHPARAAESIRRFSEKDARRWHDFAAFMNKAARLLARFYATPMPRLPKNFSLAEGFGLLDLGLALRLAGRRDMLAFVRALPMTAQELVEEWFESPPLQAAIASLGVHGLTLGPMAAGTGYTLMHNWMNRGGLAHHNVGSAGKITQALAAAARSFGGEIKLDAEVQRILVETYTCKGVLLANSDEVMARTVLSAIDPKRTFLSLVGPMNLPPEFVWKAQSIKMRGSVARVHMLTDGTHGIPAGTLVVAPSIPYLEYAYDAAKYGGISAQPYLEITTSDKVVSVHVQYAAFALKDLNWNDQRPALERLVAEALAEHFPNLRASVRQVRSLTPPDLEATYGLTEGDLNHGQLMLDQFMFMRPIPGWSNHKTPIDNLFLGGSGVHGGGGVSGLGGRNAARAVLRS
jgi:phytoene dehydrogenase-like protein